MTCLLCRQRCRSSSANLLQPLEKSNGCSSNLSPRRHNRGWKRRRRGKRWRRKEGAEVEDGDEDEGGGGAEDGGGDGDAEEAGGAIIHIMVGHMYTIMQLTLAIKIDSDIFFMIVHPHTFYIIHSQHHGPYV